MHLSDISWNEPGESAVRRYSKGEQVDTVVLTVDAERERISLGIKQLDQDPFSDFTAVHDRGSIVQAVVVEVEPKQAIVRLAEEVEGVLKASELAVDRVEDARNVLKPGDEIEVKITSVDRKNRTIAVSVKARELAEEREAVREHRQAEPERVGPTTLGDLIKAEMDRND